jgi:hypothetical protein
MMYHLDVLLVDLQLVRQVSCRTHQPLVLLLELTQQSLEGVKGIHVNVLCPIWFLFRLGTFTSGARYCVKWREGEGEGGRKVERVRERERKKQNNRILDKIQ